MFLPCMNYDNSFSGLKFPHSTCNAKASSSWKCPKGEMLLTSFKYIALIGRGSH